MDEFYRVCFRRKLKVHLEKGKLTVFERKQRCYFIMPYKECVPVARRYEIVLVGERMEEVKELKYPGTVLSKQGEMEGEIAGRVVKKYECYRSNCKGYAREKMCPWR